VVVDAAVGHERRHPGLFWSKTQTHHVIR
jgi:hypothetical protein